MLILLNCLLRKRCTQTGALAEEGDSQSLQTMKSTGIHGYIGDAYAHHKLPFFLVLELTQCLCIAHEVRAGRARIIL